METAVLMTAGDAGKRKGVVAETVRLWHRSGRLKAVAHTVGGIALFDPQDVENMETRQRKPRRAAQN